MCGLSSFVFGDSVIDWILFPFLLLMQAAVAAAIGIAVFRYRLYAIERIVNRTLVYASLTFLLLGAYIGITVGLGVFVGGDSSWVVAAATLASRSPSGHCARAFRTSSTGVIAGPGTKGCVWCVHSRTRCATACEQPEEISLVLAEALGDPARRALLLAPRDRGVCRCVRRDHRRPAAGRQSVSERSSATMSRTGVLLHDPTLLERRDLLDGVLAAAALSIEMARLRVEVRLQLAEVEASRTRIVEAGYEERRRLERDLHDGAQQRLVSLGVQLRRLQLALPRGAEVLSPALDQIVGEVGAAIADLRQIAAGVRPARLDDGLAAALRDLARSAPVPVDGRRAERTRRRRASRRLRTSSHARRSRTPSSTRSPSRVSMRAVRENGTLLVSISDDGVGGAVVRRGSGLAGLRDRVAAHGGTLEIVEPARRWHPRRGGDPMRIVIADDTVLLREGLAGLLEDAGHTVLARVGDAESLLAVVAEHEPDLAIVDVRMPPTYEDEGMRAAVEIRRTHPEIGRPRPLPARREPPRGRARRLGRRLRLPAQGPRARRGRVPRGGRSRLPAAARRSTPRSSSSSRRRRRTTTRWRRSRRASAKFSGSMAEGNTNAGIAKQLWLTEKTVETHVRSILGKLDLPRTVIRTAASSPS